MRFLGILIAACLLQTSYSTPVVPSELQTPLVDQILTNPQTASHPHLHGRFLHITDIHPDKFYKVHASTEEQDACHRGKGSSGIYGAETSDCDTPFALVNATFKWIGEHLKDSIDFVIWTGDSARHDSDEEIPRNANEVLDTNRWVAEKFAEVFSKTGDPKSSLMIPIVPTFGNNDILPHNILDSGPNKWLKTYTNIWSNFIPEEQRHGFERGGWFYVEVIPRKLAVFSLNTLYFFANNAAVDGCSLRSEAGFEHMEWLRIQLQFMRERGMKAILTGHVPPARTDSKQLWDETCWQKYTLWLQQYRDVVIGGLYGHMNIDHFMLQDTKDISILSGGSEHPVIELLRTSMDDELSVESANDYLEELRENWSDLPYPKLLFESGAEDGKFLDEDSQRKRKKRDQEKKKALKKVGGLWAERFQVTHIAPSIVPNYFPTIRVFEYNITGLDMTATWANPSSWEHIIPDVDWLEEDLSKTYEDIDNDDDNEFYILEEEDGESAKKKKGKKKKPHKPDFVVPSPPSKTAPPGPGYSPQTLTLLGYTQYFANLTDINNDDFVRPSNVKKVSDVDSASWHEGKHKGKHLKDKIPHPKTFEYQVEYETFTDSVYQLSDMTVKSYLRLAYRIGKYKPEKKDSIDMLESQADGSDDLETASAIDYGDGDKQVDIGKNGKKHRRKRHHKQHEKNKVWLQFIERAFVGSVEEEELLNFEQPEDSEAPGFEKQSRVPVEKVKIEPHDGEL